jgi:hypothetical protein
MVLLSLSSGWMDNLEVLDSGMIRSGGGGGGLNRPKPFSDLGVFRCQ